jgi:cell division septation protein DedD
MSSAPLNAVCPLCRRDMSQSATPNASRLCDDCRSIIETIRPRAAKTSPLAAGPEFKGDLSLEMPLDDEGPALVVKPAAVPAELQGEFDGGPPRLQGRPLREYEAVTMGSEYSEHFDDSLEGWPLVLKEDRSRGRSKVLVGVLGAVLVLAAAAGVFVANRFFGARHRSAGAAQVNPQALPARTGADKPPQAANLPSPAQPESGKPTPEAAVSRPNQAPAQAAQPPVEQPVHIASPATSEAGGAKLTSFQIASFPNEGAAKEFCDRLIRAGLPTYTIRADIPGRGKWFRVRAGKFGNAQESQQSATAWRKLAAAAGINLQLVQCDYEP